MHLEEIEICREFGNYSIACGYESLWKDQKLYIARHWNSRMIFNISWASTTIWWKYMELHNWDFWYYINKVSTHKHILNGLFDSLILEKVTFPLKICFSPNFSRSSEWSKHILKTPFCFNVFEIHFAFTLPQN